MPAWIHNRAEHILAKNPSMPKSQAFAIATQQSHAVGKSPKGYGTAQGRRTAKVKYPTPGDDRKTANPGDLDSPKMAAFIDELGKLAEINEQRLHPKTPSVPLAKPPNPAFAIKQAFATSEYSGVMSFGPFPQASMIPAWRQPTLKQSGPPGDSKLESTDDSIVPDGRAHLRKNAADLGVGAAIGAGLLGHYGQYKLRGHLSLKRARELEAQGAFDHDDKNLTPLKKNANVSSPAGQLAKSHTIGAPRLKAPGPSIAQQSKPRGFGVPMPGLTKQI